MPPGAKEGRSSRKEVREALTTKIRWFCNFLVEDGVLLVGEGGLGWGSRWTPHTQGQVFGAVKLDTQTDPWLN